MRKAAAILVFLVLALRAVVPALPLYVCTGMGAVHLWQPCCAGAEEHQLPAWTAGCCRPEQSASVDVALPPVKPGLVVFHHPALLMPVGALLAPVHAAMTRLQSARASPWPIGPPPPLRTILRI